MKEVLDRLKKIEDALGVNDEEISKEMLELETADVIKKGRLQERILNKISNSKNGISLLKLIKSEKDSKLALIEGIANLSRMGMVFETKRGIVHKS